MSSSLSLNTERSPEYDSVIPDDNLPQVFGYLSLEDLYRSSKVCSVWNRIAYHENLHLFQEIKNEWDAGNECLRRSLKQYSTDSRTPLDPQLTTLLQRTLCPFSDRKAIIQRLSISNAFWESAVAFRSAAAYGSLPLCESLLPFVRNTCIVEQALHHAIPNGHMHIIKKLLPEIPPENLKELMRINVICDVKEGDSVYLEGRIGVGYHDLNCWRKGFPMKKVKGSKNLWEMILLPTVYGNKKAFEYDPLVDRIYYKFRPVLHLANGRICMPKRRKYKIKPRANITITPKFNS